MRTLCLCADMGNAAFVRELILSRRMSAASVAFLEMRRAGEGTIGFGKQHEDEDADDDPCSCCVPVDVLPNIVGYVALR